MGALQKILALAEAFDPRALIRTRQRLDDVRDASRELRQSVSLLEIRTEQLMALERANWQQREQIERLPKLLNAERIGRHVRAVIERAVIVDDPLPHCVVEEWLPREVYDLLIDAIPPLVFFADRPAHKQQLAVPPPVAPEYARQIWDCIARVVVDGVVGPTLSAAFDAHLDRHIRRLLTRGGA